jgi:uncharacterized SAM-binding protein YcdF (DUF218 family)
MLIITKAIAMLILPPSGLIISALFGALFARRWWGKTILFASIILLYALATAPVRDALIKPLEYATPPLQVSTIDTQNSVVVVLGGGSYQQPPEYQKQNLPSDSGLLRTLYGAEIARNHDVDVYLSGGSPLEPDAESEAVTMQRWIIRFGVPAERTHVESTSLNTIGNAQHIAAILKQQHIKRIILVSSANHLPRARLCFEDQGLDVIAAPTDYLSKQTPYQALDYLPDAHVLADSSTALREYLGIVWYQLRN